MADITRGVRAFTFGTAVSRILGLVRESVFAFLFGVGTSTDAFKAALRILDLMRDLFAETALSSAIVPILTAQKQKGKAAMNQLASNVFNILLIATGLITLIGIIFAPLFSKIIAFGFARIPGKIELTSQLTAICFPFVLFIALAAWAMSYLNTEKEFLIPSLAPAAFNLFSIIVPVIMYAYLVKRGTDPIFGMAIGIVIGGLMQFLVQIPMLIKKGFHYQFYFYLKDPEFKKILALFIPVVIGLAGSRINIAVDAIMVSFLQEGSMTWISYAFRIMHLPLGLFGIAVGTVALPTLSKYAAEQNITELRKTLFDSLKLVFFLTVSSSVLIIFLSHPITKVIYEHGKFTPFDTAMTMQALILYMIGVPFSSGLRNIASTYYAFRDSKTPMWASVISIMLNIVLNWTLMQFIGFRGICLATSISAFANIAILFYKLPTKIGYFDIKPLLKYFFMLIIASSIAGLCGWLSIKFIFVMIKDTFITSVFALLAGGSTGLLVFYYACGLLGITEAKDYVRRLFKR